MRLSVILLTLLLAPLAQAKEFNLTGNRARAVTEALVASGLAYNTHALAPVVPETEVWVMTTSGFICGYSKGAYYDSLTSGMTCMSGSILFPGGAGNDLRNPIFLAKTLAPYAWDQSTPQQYQISVAYAKCVYTIANNRYSCVVRNSQP